MSIRVIDVHKLPKTAFGHRSLPWWGTLGFIIIEGMTLAVVAASFLYLRRNFPQWPPPPTPLPDLLVPTLNVLALLLAIVPMRHAAKAANEVDPAGVQRGLALAAGISAVALALRALEFDSVNVRWDDHAYGSAVWLLLGLHTILIIADVLETLVFWAIFRLGREEPKHYPDVEDAALYQYFLSLGWVPLYVLIYLMPRFA